MHVLLVYTGIDTQNNTNCVYTEVDTQIIHMYVLLYTGKDTQNNT